MIRAALMNKYGIRARNKLERSSPWMYSMIKQTPLHSPTSIDSNNAGRLSVALTRASLRNRFSWLGVANPAKILGIVIVRTNLASKKDPPIHHASRRRIRIYRQRAANLKHIY
jgi:hypothetical protein